MSFCDAKSPDDSFSVLSYPTDILILDVYPLSALKALFQSCGLALPPAHSHSRT